MTAKVSGDIEIDLIEERMPHPPYRNPGILVQVEFELEHDQHDVDGALDALDSAPSPGPDLRSDEIRRLDACLAGPVGQAEVEPGVVDQDQHIGARLLEVSHRLGHETPKKSQPGGNSAQAHDGEIGQPVTYPGAGTFELRTAERIDLAPGLQIPERPYEVRRVSISGRIADADEYAHDQLSCACARRSRACR